MPRPTTKAALLTAAQVQYEKLQALIATMSPEMQAASFTFEDRDKNLRDVLVHLYEWHQMMARWHQTGTLEGGMPAVPGEGYTWKTLPALNQTIWERYQSVPLEEAKALLDASHAQMLARMDAHTQAELFDRGIYKWTKSSTLGAYFISNTASHYDWAMKKIKRHIKNPPAPMS